MSERYDLEENEQWGYYSEASGSTYYGEEYLSNHQRLPRPFSTLYKISDVIIAALIFTPLLKLGYTQKPVHGFVHQLTTTLFYTVLLTTTYILFEYGVQTTAPDVYDTVITTITPLITTGAEHTALTVTATVFVIYTTTVYLMQPNDWYRDLGQKSKNFGAKSVRGGYIGQILYTSVAYIALGLYYVTVTSSGISTYALTVIGLVFFTVFIGAIIVTANHLLLLPVDIIAVIGGVYLLPLTFAEAGFVTLALTAVHFLSTDTVQNQLKADELNSNISFYPHTKWHVLTTGMYVTGIVYFMMNPSPSGVALFTIGVITTLVIYPVYRSRLPENNEHGYKTKNDYYPKSNSHRNTRGSTQSTTSSTRTTSESSADTSTSEESGNDYDFEDRLDTARTLMREQRGLTRAENAVSEDVELQLEWALEEFREEYEKHSTDPFAPDIDTAGDLTKQQLQTLEESLHEIKTDDDQYPPVRGSATSLHSAVEHTLDEWDIDDGTDITRNTIDEP